MTFDGEKFDFLGDCDYILAQVYIFFWFSYPCAFHSFILSRVHSEELKGYPVQNN